MLFILFILLQKGIYIKNISLPNVQVEKLYIKWNEKLNINIENVKIIENSKNNQEDINKEQINEFFTKIVLFDNWFEKIEVKTINFNNINGSFKYEEGKDGYLTASSNDFSLKSSLFFQSHLFNAKIDEFHDYKRNIKINGNIILDGIDKLELTSSLNLNLNNDIELKVYIGADKEKLVYKLISQKNIKSIKHTIEMFNLPKEVKYWAYDAIDISDLRLKKASGWIEYSKIDDAYKNLHILAVANGLQYTYNPKLEPVLTKKTELEFRDGILFIRPKNAYQYGFYLGKSWLKIDFTKKEELLTLFLLFKGKVNKDLLYLLSIYKIELPFLQNSGTVDTNLKIDVGLRNIDVNAKGDFFTEQSNFNYLGLNIDIFNARIFLNNYDVSIKNMYSKYEDIATASVDVDFNAKRNEGTIDFKIKDIQFKDIGLTLKKTKEPIKASYKISQTQDIIKIEPSTWIYLNQQIDLNAATIPFDLDTLVAQIPSNLVSIENLASAHVSGRFALNPIRANLDVDILDFKLDKLKMEQEKASIKVKYDKKIEITSNEAVKLKLNTLKCTLNNTDAVIDEDGLNILNSSIRIDNIGDTKFNSKYDFKNNKGELNLEKIYLNNKTFGEMFSSSSNIKIDITSNDNSLKMRAKELSIDYILKEKSWKLEIDSIKNIYKKSKLLQDYNITNGNFNIYEHSKDENIYFNAKTIFPYKVLVLENRPVSNYFISGKIDKTSDNISLKINDTIDIHVDKYINISADNIGINIDEVLTYFDNKGSSSPKETKGVIFNSKKSNIYISHNRYIVSDKLDLQYFDNVLSAQLEHKNGSAGFRLEDERFYLYGDRFNDEFMDKLFALSKFENGEFSFSMLGAVDDYDGLMYIKNTTIHEYKILNNILAFINTIPSLVTFSVPGYNKHGLHLKSAYLSFHSKNDIFDIKDISFDSQELDIVGRGKASFKHNNIDLDLTLKSNLGSSVSKIPIVGYILLDKDTISTSLKIEGKLSDPSVKSLIAKDIVVMPLNIIKRTLLAPLKLFKQEE